MMRAAALAALACAGAACAGWSRHGAAPRPPRKLVVAVLAPRIAVKVKRLASLETLPKSERHPPDERGRIDRRLRDAAEDLRRDFEVRLSSSYLFAVAADSEAARADLTLKCELSGYGAIKTKWLVYLIGSGLAEGLAEGVAAASVVGSPWAAVGIGAEEAGQESAEWGGGAWLFGRIWTPVIVECSLVSAADGRAVWSGTGLESSPGKAAKALPADLRRRREVRLRLTARRAVFRLVQRMEKKAWRNVQQP